MLSYDVWNISYYVWKNEMFAFISDILEILKDFKNIRDRSLFIKVSSFSAYLNNTSPLAWFPVLFLPENISSWQFVWSTWSYTRYSSWIYSTFVMVNLCAVSADASQTVWSLNFTSISSGLIVSLCVLVKSVKRLI